MSRVIYLVHIKIIKEFHIWRIHSVSNSRTLSRTRVREFKFDGCWKPRGMQWLVPFSRLCWDILRHLETMASLFATSGPTRTSPLEIRSTKPGTKCTKGKKNCLQILQKSCKKVNLQTDDENRVSFFSRGRSTVLCPFIYCGQPPFYTLSAATHLNPWTVQLCETVTRSCK